MTDEIIKLLEEQKTAQEKVKTEAIKNYNAMSTEYNKTVNEMVKDTEKLRQIQYSALNARQNAAKLVFDLESKNMSDGKRYKFEQEQLEKRLTQIMQLTGDQKIKELQEYQSAAKQSAESVRGSNDINVNSNRAVKNAIEQINDAQKLVDNEYKQMTKAQQAQIESSQQWLNAIEGDMASLDKTIDNVNDRIVQLSREIEKEKSYNISTEKAKQEIDDFFRYLQEKANTIYTAKIQVSEENGKVSNLGTGTSSYSGSTKLSSSVK
jgi:hypothetical protein